MEINTNTYAIRARALPMYLALVPIGLLVAAFAPVEAGWLARLSIAGVALGPISFVLGQVAADLGKRIEKQLWAGWGGPPTTRFLRHRSHELNEITRGRAHERLRGLGLQVPTLEEEAADENRADQYYEACTEELIRRTRSRTDYPLVYQGLTEYGFRRNLLGVKPLGVVFAGVGLAGSTAVGYREWHLTGSVPTAGLVVGVVSLGLLALWLAWANRRTVEVSANRYARYLIETMLDVG